MPFPTSEEFVAAAELQLGIALPDSLRARLLQGNGGELEATGDSWTLFPVADTSDRKRLTRTANHIVLETQNARRWPGFPELGVPIAANGSGDYLILLPDRPGSSQLGSGVFLWDHETGEPQLIAASIESLGEECER